MELQRIILRWAAIAAAACCAAGAVAAGCGGVEGGSGGGGGNAPAACSPDLASIRDTIFAPSCALSGCHAAESPAASLDLVSGDLASRLIGVTSATCDKTLVVPGSPLQSFLFEKITSAEPTCGDHMPLDVELTNAQKGCIEDWIAGEASPPDAGTDAEIDGGCETCGGSACVDVATDPAHCGKCDAPCPAGAACSGGQCACAGGLAVCGDACVDTMSDQAHCGGCDAPCPSGALCMGAQCACAGGLEVCGDECVDKLSDPLNCGDCGVTCSVNEVCNNGNCEDLCGALTKCGAACVDTMTSTAHCGGCNLPCPGGASCVASDCVCPQGTTECAGQCINTVTDPQNCGNCNVVCSGGQTCQASTCACPAGGMLCNGACVDTASDPANCGDCNVVCSIGQVCSGGSCVCGSPTVSFAGAVQPIFTQKCATNGCHKGAMPSHSLNLSAGSAYGEIVNVNSIDCNPTRKLVAPGAPGHSHLVDKIMNTNLCAGTQMPKNQALPAAQKQTIATWICQGALNN